MSHTLDFTRAMCWARTVQFQDLIETVMTTIQEPDVTDEGVAAVVSRLQAYSAGITGLVDTLPPEGSSTSGANWKEREREEKKPLVKDE